MFTIIETGGNQYRVTEGSRIIVEKLEAEEGSKVILDRVLFLHKDDGASVIGKPLLDNVSVEAEVVKNFRDDKVIIFKKRRRKNSRRKGGHRQEKTELKITGIKIS